MNVVEETFELPKEGDDKRNDEIMDDYYREFFKWGEERGLKVHKNATWHKFNDTAWGLIARGPIKKGELLFDVPLVCQIRPAQSPLTKQIEACADSLPGWNSLIVTLMLEFCRLPTSPWAPYLRTLPDTFTTPLYWSPEERSELEGTAVLSGLGEDEIKHDFAEGVLPFLKAHQHPWFEALQLPTPGEDGRLALDEARAYSLYLRCGNLVSSRAFSDGPAGPYMVPMADLLNSRTGRLRILRESHFGWTGARLFTDASSDTYSMHAARDLREEEEIFNTYGDLPNSELLRKYGYWDADNPFDVVELTSDEVLEIATAIIGREPPLPIRRFLKQHAAFLLPDIFVLTKAPADAEGPVHCNLCHQTNVPYALDLLLQLLCSPSLAGFLRLHPEGLAALSERDDESDAKESSDGGEDDDDDDDGADDGNDGNHANPGTASHGDGGHDSTALSGGGSACACSCPKGACRAKTAGAASTGGAAVREGESGCRSAEKENVAGAREDEAHAGRDGCCCARSEKASTRGRKVKYICAGGKNEDASGDEGAAGESDEDEEEDEEQGCCGDCGCCRGGAEVPLPTGPATGPEAEHLSRQVRGLLRAVLAGALRRYPTSIDFDQCTLARINKPEALNGHSPLSPTAPMAHLRAALVVRMAEKSILLDTIARLAEKQQTGRAQTVAAAASKGTPLTREEATAASPPSAPLPTAASCPSSQSAPPSSKVPAAPAAAETTAPPSVAGTAASTLQPASAGDKASRARPASAVTVGDGGSDTVPAVAEQGEADAAAGRLAKRARADAEAARVKGPTEKAKGGMATERGSRSGGATRAVGAGTAGAAVGRGKVLAPRPKLIL